MNRYDEFREQILDLGHSVTHFAVVLTALELNVFEALNGEVKSVPTIAGEVRLDERALGLLMNALASLNVVQKVGNGFKLGEAAKRVFLKRSEKYMGDFIKHQRLTAQSFLELAGVVASGKPLPFSLGGFQNKSLEFMHDFTHAMHSLAIAHAETLAKKLDLRGAKRLIDIGGGPATFAIHFLKFNPELKATVFDLPATIETAREYAVRFGVSDRIEFQAGDFEADPIPGGFDVAFLSHIVHGLSEEKNEALFRKIHGSLNSGGRLIVQDFFLNDDKISPQFAAIFALNMLLHTDGGRTYTFQEVRHGLEKAGFSECSRLALRLPRSMSVLSCKKG